MKKTRPFNATCTTLAFSKRQAPDSKSTLRTRQPKTTTFQNITARALQRCAASSSIRLHGPFVSVPVRHERASSLFVFASDGGRNSILCNADDRVARSNESLRLSPNEAEFNALAQLFILYLLLYFLFSGEGRLSVTELPSFSGGVSLFNGLKWKKNPSYRSRGSEIYL